jgi:hypothetical protein
MRVVANALLALWQKPWPKESIKVLLDTMFDKWITVDQKKLLYCMARSQLLKIFNIYSDKKAQQNDTQRQVDRYSFCGEKSKRKDNMCQEANFRKNKIIC